MSAAFNVYGPYESVHRGGYSEFVRDEDAARLGFEHPMDTVFWGDKITAKEVYDSLVGHDGYPADIRIEREKSVYVGDREARWDHVNEYDPSDPLVGDDEYPPEEEEGEVDT